MTTDITTSRSSRRGLLAAGLAAAAAAAAASVARFTPASAADGDAVTVGSSNEGTATTKFTVPSSKALEGVSTSGQGVNGESDSSAGVAGLSTSGNGVHGTSNSGRGVYGQSTSGPGLEGSGAIGVKAESSGGYALETISGRLKLAQVSGIATVPAGDTSVTITPGVPVSSNTLVLLTPEANLGNKDMWYTKPGGGTTFTVHLSGTRSNPTRVSYLLVDHG